MIIILLRGFSHSGKDFVGNILSTQYGYKQFSFADSLKKIVAEKYNIELNLLYSQEGKKTIYNNTTYRQLLIDEALILKEKDPDIFAKHCCKDINNTQHNMIVITDWRFYNELYVLKEYFTDAKIIPVHIIRTNQTKSPIDDISEYHLMDRKDDITIINNMDDSIYKNINNFIVNKKF
jgi:phosphomevalonate kinase